jgi:HPt (histidine-containing phosphotransfer) domain-containing protein
MAWRHSDAPINQVKRWAKSVEGCLIYYLMKSQHEQTEGGATPIDYSSALRWVEGDRALLAELTEIFVQDCPLRMKELEVSILRDDADLIKRAAHSLKGMVSGFGAHEAWALAQEMEDLGRNGRVPEAGNLLPLVMREFTQVIEYLKRADWQTLS